MFLQGNNKFAKILQQQAAFRQMEKLHAIRFLQTVVFLAFVLRPCNQESFSQGRNGFKQADRLFRSHPLSCTTAIMCSLVFPSAIICDLTHILRNQCNLSVIRVICFAVCTLLTEKLDDFDVCHTNFVCSMHRERFQSLSANRRCLVLRAEPKKTFSHPLFWAS